MNRDNNHKKLCYFRQIMWQATRNLASGEMQMSCRVFLSLKFLNNAANTKILAQLFNKAGLWKTRKAFANWKTLVIQSKQPNMISQTSALRVFGDCIAQIYMYWHYDKSHTNGLVACLNRKPVACIKMFTEYSKCAIPNKIEVCWNVRSTSEFEKTNKNRNCRWSK